MKVGVMITEGGPHPPEKWAEQTAEQIIDIVETAPEALLSEARAFRAQIVEILTVHHATVQETERNLLEASGAAHHAVPIDPSPHLADPVDAIIAAAQDKSFAEHFNKPETRAYLEQTIGSHFATAMHVERSWHRDRTQGVQ